MRAKEFTFNQPKRKLNIPELIKRGAIFVTHPHGPNGWETDRPDWDFSLITLQNVLQKSPDWVVDYKKYITKDKKLTQNFIDKISDQKYQQILWSIEKLGIPNNVAFLDQQGVAESVEQVAISVHKGRNKFATEMTVNGKPAGIYQYDANSGRSIAEVYPEYKGKGFGKILVLHAIYTAAQLGMNFIEDESRTAEYDNVLDSLDSNGYAINDEGYWYVTDEGEQFLKQSLKQGVAEGGAETWWSDGNEKITLQDILELTKHIKQINLPINDNLKSKLIHWDGNPEEIERINQVTVSNQFPILVMLDGQDQIEWILDGNHRLHKAIQSQAETIPAKLIKPSDLSDKAKRVFNIKEQNISEGKSL